MENEEPEVVITNINEEPQEIQEIQEIIEAPEEPPKPLPKPKPKRASRAKPKIIKEEIALPAEPIKEEPTPPLSMKPQKLLNPSQNPNEQWLKKKVVPVEQVIVQAAPEPREITREDVDNFLRNERLEKAKRNQAKYKNIFYSSII